MPIFSLGKNVYIGPLISYFMDKKTEVLNKKLLYQDHSMSREAMCYQGKVNSLEFTVPGFSSFFPLILTRKLTTLSLNVFIKEIEHLMLK